MQESVFDQVKRLSPEELVRLHALVGQQVATFVWEVQITALSQYHNVGYTEREALGWIRTCSGMDPCEARQSLNEAPGRVRVRDPWVAKQLVLALVTNGYGAEIVGTKKIELTA